MKLRHAADIMTYPVVTIGQEALLTDAIRILLRHHISGLPVVDASGKMVGIITESDIMNFAQSGDAADTKVSEAMVTEVVTLEAEAPIETVISTLSGVHVRRIPILSDGKLIGIVSRRDVLREMLSMYSKY